LLSYEKEQHESKRKQKQESKIFTTTVAINPLSKYIKLPCKAVTSSIITQNLPILPPTVSCNHLPNTAKPQTAN